MKSVYLYPQSSLKTELRSDTLWGLIIVALSYLYDDDEVQRIVDSFKDGDPLFNLTSAMFFQEIDGRTKHFFPMPVSEPIDSNFIADENKDQLKKFKKISLVEKSIFEKMINGEINLLDYFHIWLTEEEKKKEEERNQEEKRKKDSEIGERKKIFRNESILKTHIDRINNSTKKENNKGQLHYSHEKFINDGGLFFLINGGTEKLEGALRFLEHFGFGGNRSTGKGFFKIEIKDFSINIPDDPTHHVNLSLYSPSKKELDSFSEHKDKICYDLTMRGGIASQTSQYHKNSVICFSEGSVFPFTKAKSIGRLHKVHSNKDIYFNGISYMIPAKIKEPIYAAH